MIITLIIICLFIYIGKHTKGILGKSKSNTINSKPSVSSNSRNIITHLDADKGFGTPFDEESTKAKPISPPDSKL